MRRTRLLLPLALAAVLVAAGCGSSSDEPAATVNDVAITRASLEADLKAIGSDDTYRAALEDSYGSKLAGDAKGTFSKVFAAQVLSLRVYYELIEQALKEGGEKITADDLEQAEDAIVEQFRSVDGGEDIFDGFPKAYRERLVRQEALVAASRRMVLGDAGDAETYFNANRAAFAQTCLSHILIGVADRDDAAAKALAATVKGRLDRGEAFAGVADEVSDDEGPGGDLGCHIPGNFVPEFEAGMNGATIGKVTDPVKSEFGYHLILVRERRSPTFVDVREEVQAVVDGQAAEQLDEFLRELSCGTEDEPVDVDVDERYGEWDVSECDGAGGIGRVAAPGGSTTTTTTDE